MKKILAMLLALAMLFSLAACAGSDKGGKDTDKPDTDVQTTPDDTGDKTPDAQPSDGGDETDEGGETTASGDFTWNGQKEVWSILPTTGAEGLVMINDAMGAVMEAEGFTYVKKDAQGDPTAQVQFVEDAIAAGNVGALMIAAMDVDLLQDVVEEAVSKGIAVAYLGAEPTKYQIAGCVYTAYEITGMYAVQAAEYWVKNSGANVPTNADGKYEIAIDTYYDIADGVYRSNAMKGTAEKSDILSLVAETSSYGSSAYSDAYDNAKDVLNANPDCHLFIAYEPEEAMGTADAIADYCDQNGLSVADYCVIPCYAEDTAFTEMYNAAAADPSANAIKGYSTYGTPASPYNDDTAKQVGAGYEALAAFSQNINPDVITPPLLTGCHLADILLGTCGIDGFTWTYGETFYDTITAVTVDGFSATWSMGDENPAAEYKTLN